MKIKSKQCVRLDNGMFFKAEDKLIPIVGGLMCNFIYLEVGDYIGDLQYKITKVADTPQELIEEKDLVFVKLYSNRYEKTVERMGFVKYHDIIKDTKVLSVTTEKGDNIDWYNGKNIDNDEIIKILTPNGKDYICQWEAE